MVRDIRISREECQAGRPAEDERCELDEADGIEGRSVASVAIERPTLSLENFRNSWT